MTCSQRLLCWSIRADLSAVLAAQSWGSTIWKVAGACYTAFCTAAIRLVTVLVMLLYRSSLALHNPCSWLSTDAYLRISFIRQTTLLDPAVEVDLWQLVVS